MREDLYFILRPQSHYLFASTITKSVSTVSSRFYLRQQYPVSSTFLMGKFGLLTLH
jgi:hypothetical protein